MAAASTNGIPSRSCFIWPRSPRREGIRYRNYTSSVSGRPRPDIYILNRSKLFVCVGLTVLSRQPAQPRRPSTIFGETGAKSHPQSVARMRPKCTFSPIPHLSHRPIRPVFNTRAKDSISQNWLDLRAIILLSLLLLTTICSHVGAFT